MKFISLEKSAQSSKKCCLPFKKTLNLSEDVVNDTGWVSPVSADLTFIFSWTQGSLMSWNISEGLHWYRFLYTCSLLWTNKLLWSVGLDFAVGSWNQSLWNFYALKYIPIILILKINIRGNLWWGRSMWLGSYIFYMKMTKTWKKKIVI